MYIYCFRHTVNDDRESKTLISLFKYKKPKTIYILSNMYDNEAVDKNREIMSKYKNLLVIVIVKLLLFYFYNI